jgi:hypothetical protein
MKKSRKAYLNPKQANSKEGFKSSLERNIADLKIQCEYEIDRLEKAQHEANQLELQSKITRQDIAIFESNKAAFEDKAFHKLMEFKGRQLALEIQEKQANARSREAEQLMRQAQARIEAAEAIEKRIKDRK